MSNMQAELPMDGKGSFSETFQVIFMFLGDFLKTIKCYTTLISLVLQYYCISLIIQYYCQFWQKI